VHVYRWDLDKTYLDTDIHSVRGMIRTALESASQKRNVPGAATLLRGLIKHDPTCRVTVLSGSPTQMRRVLARKLQLDGIRFERLILKDNLNNIRMGRFRAVRDQVGYKLPQLLRMRVEEPIQQQTETLFGDDSEADALIYALYGAAIAGRLDGAELKAVMEAAGAYPDAVQDALRSIEKLSDRAPAALEDVFIHCERGVPASTFRLLGRGITPVFSWYQAALVLACRGRLHPDVAAAVAQRVAGASPRRIAALTQDIVRRGAAGRQDVQQLFSSTPALSCHAEQVNQTLDHLGQRFNAPRCADRPRWMEFMNANEARRAR